MWFKLNIYFIVGFVISLGSASITDYLKNVVSLFTLNSHEEQNDLQATKDLDQQIPYEVSVPDQKFISQAIKLTGVQESELDSCQHRVVLKLHNQCHKLNDEELAKMAVALLNCQSLVEGRRVYPCTDTMSIKDCTIGMDADTWNTYHLMSNRARAVCYSIRQVQFRGITEQTVNKLMDAARQQISTLDKISTDQVNLQNLAENTLSTVSKGYKDLESQQNDLHQAQLFVQLSLEDNIKRLADEKKVIAETREHFSKLTQSVHSRLEKAADQLEAQSHESHSNHQELLDDMMRIHNMAQIIFQKIEDSSKILLEQSQMAAVQYDLTLKQLSEVNFTVHSLVNLIGTTKQTLDEKLNWITSALGGTDLAIERLYIVLWHSGFLIMSMIVCAFLSAKISTRLFVATILPLNLALALNGNENAQNPMNLAGIIGVLVVVQTFILLGLEIKRKGFYAISWKTKSNQKEPSPVTSGISSTSSKNLNGFKRNHLYETAIDEQFEEECDYSNPTPPQSRNGFYASPRSRSRTPSVLSSLTNKSNCHATTRMGTPCKLTSLPGRDYCYRHQSGDSVMGSS